MKDQERIPKRIPKRLYVCMYCGFVMGKAQWEQRRWGDYCPRCSSDLAGRVIVSDEDLVAGDVASAVKSR